MRRGAYYNEHDPFAAAWLRNLISAGHIAPGDVDERDIRDIQPGDLRGYVQCHFFAGIGVWSYALRNAGWADDRPIWTGSCPCQPFSAAGRGDGFADERHLWPYWHWLIAQLRPPVVAGEQVASKDGLGRLDLVSADLEGTNYAFGASDLCAAGFSGAHIRQRLYFVGLVDVQQQGLEGYAGDGSRGDEPRRIQPDTPGSTAAAGGSGGLDHSSSARCVGSVEEPEGNSRNEARLRVSGDGCSDGGLAGAVRAGRAERGSLAGDGSPAGSSVFGRLANNNSNRCIEGKGNDSAARHRDTAPAARSDGNSRAPLLGRNPVDWLYCRDGKWRPVEPGTFPLVDQTPSRVGRLRAYGNALDAETATQFVGAVKAIDDFLAVV